MSGGLGCYLAFFASLTYGLEGLWIGVLTGNGVAVGALFLNLICTDWNQELRKFALFSRKGNDSNASSYYGLVLSGVETRSIGGLYFRNYRNVDQEIEELEQLEEIEVVINDNEV